MSQKVFYVGQSVAPKKRLIRHISDSLKLQSGKDILIQDLIKNGHIPIVKELDCLLRIGEETDYEFSCRVCKKEKYWIDFYKIDNNLTNIENNSGGKLKQKDCLYCLATFSPNKLKQKFCSDKCRVYAFRENRIPQEVVKEVVQPTVKITVERKRLTLADIQAMCPPHLKGLDKSEWVSKKRVELGV